MGKPWVILLSEDPARPHNYIEYGYQLTTAGRRALTRMMMMMTLTLMLVLMPEMGYMCETCRPRGKLELIAASQSALLHTIPGGGLRFKRDEQPWQVGNPPCGVFNVGMEESGAAASGHRTGANNNSSPFINASRLKKIPLLTTPCPRRNSSFGIYLAGFETFDTRLPGADLRSSARPVVLDSFDPSKWRRLQTAPDGTAGGWCPRCPCRPSGCSGAQTFWDTAWGRRHGETGSTPVTLARMDQWMPGGSPTQAHVLASASMTRNGPVFSRTPFWIVRAFMRHPNSVLSFYAQDTTAYAATRSDARERALRSSGGIED